MSGVAYYHNGYNTRSDQPEPKPVLIDVEEEPARTAIRYLDPDARLEEPEAAPLGGRLRY